MKIQVQAGICLALLASVIPIAAHAQTANGSPQKTGDKQGTGTAETNGTSGQRKSGQVVHQDFGRVQENKSNGSAAPAPIANGNGAQESSMKVRQEFGPQQVNKRTDLVAPPAGSNGGKPRTNANKQAPK